MTRNKAVFVTLQSNDDEYVTFGNNSKGKIIGVGSIGKNPSLIIENALFVKV